MMAAIDREWGQRAIEWRASAESVRRTQGQLSDEVTAVASLLSFIHHALTADYDRPQVERKRVLDEFRMMARRLIF